MNRWELKRQEKLKEYITLSFMVTGFILTVAFISLLKRDYILNLSNFLVCSVLLVTISGLILLLGNFGHKILGRAILVDRPNLNTYLISIFFVVLVALFVLNTGGAASRAKVLFFLPIMVLVGHHGRAFGLGLTALITVFLVSLDVISFPGVFPNRELEIDLIYISIMFLLSWLLGGLANVEKDVRKELVDLASMDDLTELFNHRSFQEKLSIEIEQAYEQGKPMGLIMLDIDYFKYYNDTFGHQQGDEVLYQLGALLKMEAPAPGFVARYGGEEFAIVLPGATQEEALKTAERIRQRIELFPFYGSAMQPQGRLTASLGVAMFPYQAKNKEELIRLADQALYRAKYASKNRVELYFSVFDEIKDEVDDSEQSLLTSIRTLISVINAKDRYTFGHSERMVVYTMELARKLGWAEEQVNLFKYGAFLHDIGKIEISRELLNKPGALNEEEWEIMKQHPVWGSEIVLPISSLEAVEPIIRYHHENFDGTGYPGGLKGQDIPIGARILRIVDSFDAMTTNRVYRMAKTRWEAVEELRRGVGKYFDPQLVEPFIELVLENDWGNDVYER